MEMKRETKRASWIATLILFHLLCVSDGFVPAKNAEVVTESGQSASKAGGVTFLRMENNAAVYAVGSGTYRFQSTLPEGIR